MLKVNWKGFTDMIGNLISKILLLLQNNIKMLVNKAIFLVTNNIKAQMFTLYYKWILVAPSIIILIKLWNFRHLTLDTVPTLSVLTNPVLCSKWLISNKLVWILKIPPHSCPQSSTLAQTGALKWGTVQPSTSTSIGITRGQR